MNYLAHLYLSGSDHDVIIGNLIADSVKGSKYKEYRPGIQKGILLHRKIDAFTDAHPAVEASKSRLRKKYHKFAGVIVDMFYDHFLAIEWERYSKADLYDTTVHAYEILLANFMILPARIKRILPFMLASNWLYSYKDLKMMERFFKGMSKRAAFYSGMEHAVDDLKDHYSDFKKDFESFFPELLTFVDNSSKNLNN